MKQILNNVICIILIKITVQSGGIRSLLQETLVYLS